MRRRTVSWHVKLPLLLVLFAIVPLVAYGYWTLELMAETFERVTLERVGGLAKAKAATIEQFTADRRRDVESIAHLVAPHLIEMREMQARKDEPPTKPAPEPLPELKDAEALKGNPPPEPNPLESPPPDEPPAHPPSALDKRLAEAASALRQKLGLILWDQQEFEELLVVDADGEVLASTFAGHEGRTAAELSYFQGGLRATYVQPVFLSPITERLTMVIAGPIRDDKREVLGVLAARLNLSRFFLVVNDPTGLGETGETIVGKIIDDKVVFMAPTRHDASAALKRSVSANLPGGGPLQRAGRGQSGKDVVIDYRGECAYAAWQHVPSLGWGMATKIDCSEAMAPVGDARSRTLLFAVALGAVALLSALLVAQALVRPLRALQNATDRISRGDFDVRIDIAPGDEIGDLADSFERMIAAIKFFRERSRGDDEDELSELEEPSYESSAE